MLTAGAIVKGGYYFNRDKPDLVAVGGKEGALPGAEGQRYFRVPALAVVALAPLLGSILVVLMPLFGFVLVLVRLGRLTIAGARRKGRGVPFTGKLTRHRGAAHVAGHAGEQAAAEHVEAAQDGKDGNARPDSPEQS